MARRSRSKKRKTTARSRGPLPILLLNIAIVISVLVLVVSTVTLIREVRDYENGYYSESGARYRVEDEEFGRLASDLIDNGRLLEPALDEPEYVGMYTLAAYLYRANAEAGDKALADKYKAVTTLRIIVRMTESAEA